MTRYTVAPPDPRFVIVHYHILKNGGSTLEYILEREFGNAFATLHGENAGDVLNGGQLAEFLAARADILALSSHHLRYPLPEIPGTIFFDCCFLRHPLTRLNSVYKWFRRAQSTDRLCMKARQYDSADFMRFLLDELPNMVCDVQVTQLARGGAFTRPANRTDCERALRLFADMAIPGVVEMFDQSLVAAEYFLRAAFPALRLEYTAQNVSPGDTESGPDGQQRLIKLWGSALYSQVARMNQFDLALFDDAKEEIARRFNLIPDTARRMSDFETRCRGLAAVAAPA